MPARLLLATLFLLAFGLTACGGGARAQTADLLALHQPTPDPTLDAVVRDLPKALAGVAPTATPTPKPVLVPKPAVPVKQPPAKPTATPTRH